MKKKLLIAAGIALLLLVVLASIFGSRRSDATEVFLATAAKRSITQTVKASGQLQPRVKVNISAHVVGKIEKLYVEEGQAIAAGDPFLELEPESYRAARDHARAQLAMGRTEVRQAEVALADQAIRLERARRLRDEGISSGEALETATLEHTSARLRLEQAGESVKQAAAQLSKAEDDLRKTTIFAPISGRVIVLSAEQGEVVVSGTMNNPASVIGTIADVSEVLAEIDVDETEIVHLALGQRAWVRVDALPEREFASRVVEIGSSGYAKPAQPDVTFFRVKLLLDTPEPTLRPGMSARADIEVAMHAEAVVVPIQAVVERRGSANPAASAADAAIPSASAPGTVEVADGAERRTRRRNERQVVFVVEKGEVREQPVSIGISDATEVEISEGLAEGAEVVTGPQRVLRRIENGEAVREKSPELGREKSTGSDEESE